MATMFTIQLEGTRGGGVALYVKQELACKFLSCKSLVVDDLFKCCSIEMLVSGHRNSIVSCIYIYI